MRAQCPTSARPGDAAIVLPDGTIEGFVGGQCAEESVRVAALDVLEHGESTLLRILPDDSEAFPDTPGAITMVNPCLSGGAIEVFLEPKLPAARVPSSATPRSPTHSSSSADATRLRDGMLTSTRRPSTARRRSSIASHGRAEEETIRAALDAGVDFIGLVASRTRGTAVIESLGLNDDERRVVHSPVGVDIGARTAEEIALSILAERRPGRSRRRTRSAEDVRHDAVRPDTAIDPVCGMTVTIVDDTAHLAHDGVDYWFCNPGCRTRYAEELGVA